MDKKDILIELNKAVEMLSLKGIESASLYIAGSSAMILRDAKFRGTMDIDLAKSVGKTAREILKKYQINDDMAIATDPNISDDLEYVDQASDLILESKGIKVYLVWQELVLILKDFYSSRAKDIMDVKAMVGKVDADKLDKSLDLIIKSRERNGQKEPFINDFKSAVAKLKG